MIHWNPAIDEKMFEVCLGHDRVLVAARDLPGAVREARRSLSLQYPRLWDVIHGLDVERFQVREAG